MDKKWYVDKQGNGRGYHRREGGSLEIVTVPMIDGSPVDTYGAKLQPIGGPVELKGWPDHYAVPVHPNLLVAIRYKQPRYYLGWEYWDGRGTTAGEPNPDPGPYHGRLSTAGSASAFWSKKERDTWITRAPAGTIREAINKTELRQLKRGYTKAQYKEYIRALEWELED